MAPVGMLATALATTPSDGDMVPPELSPNPCTVICLETADVSRIEKNDNTGRLQRTPIGGAEDGPLAPRHEPTRERVCVLQDGGAGCRERSNAAWSLVSTMVLHQTHTGSMSIPQVAPNWSGGITTSERRCGISPALGPFGSTSPGLPGCVPPGMVRRGWWVSWVIRQVDEPRFLEPGSSLVLHEGNGKCCTAYGLWQRGPVVGSGEPNHIEVVGWRKAVGFTVQSVGPRELSLANERRIQLPRVCWWPRA